MASISALCFKAALLALAAGVSDLPEEEDCKTGVCHVSLLQQEIQLHGKVFETGKALEAESPTVAPTAGPPVAPTSGPTMAPVPPTAGPPVAPTSGPTMAPLPPTAGPPVAPTSGPTVAPTAGPPVAPTSGPTVAPVPPTAGPPVAPTSGPPVAPTAGPPAAAGSKILIIGDSNAAFAGPFTDAMIGFSNPKNTLQDACAGSTVVNKADPGTAIVQWMKPADGTEGMVEDAFKKAGKTGWTHVWICIGANDLGAIHACGPKGSKKDRIKSDLNNVIAEVRKQTAAKIVLTGYAISPAEDTCSVPAMRDNVYKAYEEIAAADSTITFASIATAGGGVIDKAARAAAACDDLPVKGDTMSPLIGVTPCRGDRKFFSSDLIHLNNAGYAAAFGLPAVQTAFGCGPAGPTVAPTAGPPVLPTSGPTVAPTAGPPVAGSCTDNDAGVAAASPFPSCAALLATEYNCKHPVHGPQIRKTCAASCKCAAPKCCA